MPKIVKNPSTSKADYRVAFTNKNQEENKNFSGFEVAVYDINKMKEFYLTDEFPKKRDNSSTDNCDNIEGHLIETGDYAAEEIYIPLGDDCYDPILFFSVTDGQYIYNIVPTLKNGSDFAGDPMIGISDELPEFFVAISQFENIDIIKPKAKPKPKPVKITIPIPASYKIDNLGRLVCAKKNDKPSKSKKNKRKHLDMECCLDPDEYPNPNCYYSIDKYEKYLK